MNMKFSVLLLIAVFAWSSSPALAAPTKKELQAKFEQRYPEIRKFKTEGKLGETSEGFIEAVKSAEGALATLIADENNDRRALYQLIAAEQSITPEAVAKLAAQKNFQRAKPGDYLKENGAWKQK